MSGGPEHPGLDLQRILPLDLAGGALAAVSPTLPLPLMGLLALIGAGLLSRPAARRAAVLRGAPAEA